MIFVVDGAKALRRAIADVYGELGLVQRCQAHKGVNGGVKCTTGSVLACPRSPWEGPVGSVRGNLLELATRFS